MLATGILQSCQRLRLEKNLVNTEPMGFRPTKNEWDFDVCAIRPRVTQLGRNQGLLPRANR
jgi:hypothetical protein